MPTLRKMIDSGELDAASPLAKQVGEHVQDPVGSTKDMFEDLGNARLEYDMKKEAAKRQLAPAKAVISHVEQLHELAPDEEEGYDPNMVDPNTGMPMAPPPGQMAPPMGGKPPMAGMPAVPGKPQPMPGPGGKASYPGAGPKVPGAVVPGQMGKPGAVPPARGAMPGQPQPGAAKPPAAGPKKAAPKKGASGREVKVHVSAKAMQAGQGYSIQSNATRLESIVGQEQLRTMSVPEDKNRK
jgi:hypothetical protein